MTHLHQWTMPHMVQIMACHQPIIWIHDDVKKWKNFPRYWPFVRGIHRSMVNSPHKGQWRGALMFSLICVWINGWVNIREAGDLRRVRAHYDVTVMQWLFVVHLTLRNKLQWNFYRIETFSLSKCIWKCCLQNGGHFFSASIMVSYNVDKRNASDWVSDLV